MIFENEWLLLRKMMRAETESTYALLLFSFARLLEEDLLTSLSAVCYFFLSFFRPACLTSDHVAGSNPLNLTEPYMPLTLT